MAWDESKHPRDWKGRFARVGSKVSKAAKTYGPPVAMGAFNGALIGGTLGPLRYPGGVNVPVPIKRNKEFDKILKASGYKPPRTKKQHIPSYAVGAATGAFAGGAQMARVTAAREREKRAAAERKAKRATATAKKKSAGPNPSGRYYK